MRVLLLDKTGTLTEERVRVCGFLAAVAAAPEALSSSSSSPSPSSTTAVWAPLETKAQRLSPLVRAVKSVFLLALISVHPPPQTFLDYDSIVSSLSAFI
jgi:hypothetical protein